MLEQARAEGDQKLKSLSRLDFAKTRHPLRDEKLSQSEFYKTLENVMLETIYNLNNQVSNVVKQTMIEALQTCNMNHNKAFLLVRSGVP